MILCFYRQEIETFKEKHKIIDVPFSLFPRVPFSRVPFSRPLFLRFSFSKIIDVPFSFSLSSPFPFSVPRYLQNIKSYKYGYDRSTLVFPGNKFALLICCTFYPINLVLNKWACFISCQEKPKLNDHIYIIPLKHI